MAKTIIEAKCIHCLVAIWNLDTMTNEFNSHLIHPYARKWIEMYPECKFIECDSIYKIENYDDICQDIMKTLGLELSNS